MIAADFNFDSLFLNFLKAIHWNWAAGYIQSFGIWLLWSSAKTIFTDTGYAQLLRCNFESSI